MCNNIYDATLKKIAVAKVKANMVVHICGSIAWQAGARPVSQPPAPRAILVSLDGAAADDSSSMRLILKTSETFVCYGGPVGSSQTRPFGRGPHRGMPGDTLALALGAELGMRG